MTRTVQIVAGLLLASLSITAHASDDLGRYVGWTIAAKKTIVGYVDEDGKREDSFQGCNYGRKIIFDDQTYLTCNGYGYHYAYRPDAVLLVKNGSIKMIVDGEDFDLQ